MTQISSSIKSILLISFIDKHNIVDINFVTVRSNFLFLEQNYYNPIAKQKCTSSFYLSYNCKKVAMKIFQMNFIRHYMHFFWLCRIANWYSFAKYAQGNKNAKICIFAQKHQLTFKLYNKRLEIPTHCIHYPDLDNRVLRTRFYYLVNWKQIFAQKSAQD